MNQIEKVAMKSFNHFLEEGDGDMATARRLFHEWVGEFSPQISKMSGESWTSLLVAIDYCFRDAGWLPNGD